MTTQCPVCEGKRQLVVQSTRGPYEADTVPCPKCSRSEPLAAYVQRVWVATGTYAKADRSAVVQAIADLETGLTALAEGLQRVIDADAGWREAHGPAERGFARAELSAAIADGKELLLRRSDGVMVEIKNTSTNYLRPEEGCP